MNFLIIVLILLRHIKIFIINWFIIFRNKDINFLKVCALWDKVQTLYSITYSLLSLRILYTSISLNSSKYQLTIASVYTPQNSLPLTNQKMFSQHWENLSLYVQTLMLKTQDGALEYPELAGKCYKNASMIYDYNFTTSTYLWTYIGSLFTGMKI